MFSHDWKKLNISISVKLFEWESKCRWADVLFPLARKEPNSISWVLF